MPPLGTPSPGGMRVPVILDGMNCWGRIKETGCLFWSFSSCYYDYYVLLCIVFMIILYYTYSTMYDLFKHDFSNSVFHDFLWDFRSSFGILSDQAAVDPISCSSGWLPAVNVQPGSQL